MTGLSYCLSHALRIQRRMRDWAQVPALLKSVSETCEKPSICQHADVGCRELCARYLRPFVQRERVSQANAGARAAERVGRTA